jgi:hypothetical protein
MLRPRGVVLGLALALGLEAASSSLLAREGGARPLRYFANMPFSMDSFELPPQVHFTEQHLKEDDNLVALHMDWFGIPWDAFANGTPLPPAYLAEIDRIDRLRRRLALPVYLAVTPIAGARDRLASQTSGSGDLLLFNDNFGARCEDITLRRDFSDLRRAFHAYVNYLAGRFEPRFLALSIEVNLYQQICPQAWPSMRDFLNDELDAQKRERPEIPIFHTFQLDAIWEADGTASRCFGFRRECLSQNMAVLRELKTDLFALSIYPVGPFVNNGRKLPDDYISAVADLSGLPVAVAETGYLSQTLSAPVGEACVPGLPSSPEDQLWWLDRLLADAERLRMPFLVWWANEAPMPFSALAPCRCTETTVFCDLLTKIGDAALSVRFFGLMALRDYDGEPTPALARWRSAVASAAGREVPSPPSPPPHVRAVSPR